MTDGVPPAQFFLKTKYGSHSPNSILVNSCQKGNPLLKFIRNVPYEFSDDVEDPADYLLSPTTCALFLSLRYHRLHSEYIYDRIKKLHKRYRLRVLLVLVDVADHAANIRELSALCVIANLTIVLSFSIEESARYLETFKTYEHKGSELLRGDRSEEDHLGTITECLTTVKSVNKTDAITLLSNFGSFSRMSLADADNFLMCHGFGENKARRLYEAFHQPFIIERQGVTNVPDEKKPSSVNMIE